MKKVILVISGSNVVAVIAVPDQSMAKTVALYDRVVARLPNDSNIYAEVRNSIDVEAFEMWADVHYGGQSTKRAYG